MFASVLIILSALHLSKVNAVPVSQPAYANPQYYVEPQQYQQQQQQPQYISAHPIPQAPTPIYVGATHRQPQYIPQNPPTQRVAQLLLPSSADRQVQKVAQQVAGPEYAQQIQVVQQQGLANEAIENAQRRAQAQLRRAHQQQQQQIAHQSAQQKQYLAEVSPKQQYIQVHVPAAAAAHQQHQQQQQQAPQQYQIQYEQQEYAERPKSYRPVVHQPQQRIKQQEEEEQEEEQDNNSTYQFGFDVKDDVYTNYQNRKEQRQGGKISGSYSVVDSDGFIRTVTYTADPKTGFKAEVVREPTDIVVKVPKPKVEHQEPQVHRPQYIQEIPTRYHQVQQVESHQSEKPQIIYQYQ